MSVDAKTISRASREAPLPLSFTQELLFGYSTSNPTSTRFNRSLIYELVGRADRTRDALAHVVSRHEAFRTTFHRGADGKALQVAGAVGVIELASEDLRPLAPSEREARVRAYAAEAVEGTFDLGRGPLFRARHFQLEDDRQTVVVTYHHIIVDVMSAALVGRELQGAISALSRGEEPSLPPVTLQYADFAAWQRAFYQGPALGKLAAFWKTALAGAVPVELPLDRPRPAELTGTVARAPIEFSADLVTSAARLAEAAHTSVSMVLLAALHALLFSYSRQEDMVVVVTTTKRRADVQRVMGPFADMLFVRTKLDDKTTVKELVARVTDGLLLARKHKDLSPMVLDPVGGRKLAGMVFNFVALTEEEDSGTMVDTVFPGQKPHTREGFDEGLTLYVSMPAKGAPVGWLAGAEELFERATLERLLAELTETVRAMAESPERAIGDLPRRR